MIFRHEQIEPKGEHALRVAQMRQHVADRPTPIGRRLVQLRLRQSVEQFRDLAGRPTQPRAGGRRTAEPRIPERVPVGGRP